MKIDFGETLVIAPNLEGEPDECVWGTGGWQVVEWRRALDWLTLLRLAGWRVDAVRHSDKRLHDALERRPSRVIIACDSASLDSDVLAQLRALTASEPVLIVGQATTEQEPFAEFSGTTLATAAASGHDLMATTNACVRRWTTRHSLTSPVLECRPDVTVCGVLGHQPIAALRMVGASRVLSIGFDPSALRDSDQAATAFLFHLLVHTASFPSAWFDWQHTMVLRMDDPGGAQNVYFGSWSYQKLSERCWNDIALDLAGRRARMSLGYIAGWVDDGDSTRGNVAIHGQTVPRVPGAVYDSSAVRYVDLNGHSPGAVQDYEAEFRGIERIRAAALGDVELHGFTHIHPDRAAWLRSSDRYEGERWFRELGRPAQPYLTRMAAVDRPLAQGMRAIQRQFHCTPTTLICPGDEWTNDVLEDALRLGLHLVDSYYLAIRIDNRFCWAQHVCAPYLDQPDAEWFDSTLPVIGYCHDYEPARHGVQWFTGCLDQWARIGAGRFIDFRELASALCRTVGVSTPKGELCVETDENSVAAVRSFRVNICWPEGHVPDHITVRTTGPATVLPIEPLTACSGRVQIPSI